MKLNILSVCPDDIRFLWEIRVFLNNLRKLKLSDKAQILFFCPKDREWNPDVDVLMSHFPEARIFKYKDEDNLMRIIGIFNYIPLLRLYCLAKHFKAHPELEKEAIFYCDSDIIFLKEFDFSPYLNDDISYLSFAGNPERTNSYIWSEYFDSKENDVLPGKLNEYKKIDVLNTAAELVGINRTICEANKMNTGGAQYLLKNIDSKFWEKCLNDCCSIRYYLHREINPLYFSSEDKGFQSWCADMWAVLWNLWKRGMKTECPTSFDFAWATDEISSIGNKTILHNAGINSDSKMKRRVDKIEVEAPAFYKGAYSDNSPFNDTDYIQSIITHPISSLYGTSLYCNAIQEAKINLNL